jgi:hypothetical protein
LGRSTFGCLTFNHQSLFLAKSWRFNVTYYPFFSKIQVFDFKNGYFSAKCFGAKNNIKIVTSVSETRCRSTA